MLLFPGEQQAIVVSIPKCNWGSGSVGLFKAALPLRPIYQNAARFDGMESSSVGAQRDVVHSKTFLR